MRLDICGQFVVNVVRPNGGWSKGRPIAFIEERDAFRQMELLIPNDLSDDQLERYVVDRFSTFAKPGKAIRRLDARPSTTAAPRRPNGCEVPHAEAI